MSQQAGNGLYVSPVVEDVHGKGVTGKMPADVLVYSGSFYPPLD